jgi:hypothetical protein
MPPEAEPKFSRPPVELPADVRVVNIGLRLLGDAIRSQGHTAVDVDWRIPAGGDETLIRALERLRGPLAARIDRANAEVFRRLDTGTPVLTGLAAAHEVVPMMTDRTVLHCGPPLGWEDFCDPLRRSVRAVVMAEGWATNHEQADDLVDRGEVELDSANGHATVLPMATALGPTSPVFVVENRAGRNHAFAPLNQGPGKNAWFGVDEPEAVERLRWLRDAAGPLLAEAIGLAGPIDIFSLAAQGIQMGDDLHMRTQATGNLLLRDLIGYLVDVGSRHLGDFMRFWSSNHHFFLNVAMAGAKVITDWAAGVPDSSVVVGMARNGTTYGIRLAGMGGRWFIAPAPPVQHAMFYSGFGPEVSAPDIGDSAVLELVGLGGPAAAGAPVVAPFVGGTMADARAVTESLDRISVGLSSRFKIPVLDFRGTPVGVDVRKVVELGITPSVNTGILHATDGIGQVGAGVAEAPIECFQAALMALDAALT